MIHFAGSSQAPSSYLVLEHVFTAFYSNTEACAKKLTLILENSIGNGGEEDWTQNLWEVLQF